MPHTPHSDPHACPEYNEISRRGFLGVTAGSALLTMALAGTLPRVSFAKEPGPARDVIVTIYLRGATDGLTLCVPYADPSYYTHRPLLAIPRPDTTDPNRCTDLDGFFGLPPAMLGLRRAYLDGKLLIVHAAGSIDPSRSHFEAQRYMEVGVAREPSVFTGWLGRHLQTVAPLDPEAPLRAVGISSGLQLSLAGGPNTIPIANLSTFDIGGNGTTLAARRSALSDMYSATGAPLAAVAATTFDTITMLDTINFATYAPTGGAVYPNTNFGTAMKQAAALIKAQVGVEAVNVDLGGWDTHNDQGNTGAGFLAGLMANLANTLGAFYTDAIASGNQRITLVAMSEFGREARENASRGTDHGHGNAMFVLGSCITGGRVLRQWPGLAAANLYDGRDLAITTDYRDILAEIVQRRLTNNNLSSVFPNYTPTFRGVTSC